MTGTVLYEVRRVRDQQEMAAALRAAPRRVLRRAGRPRARRARRPRPRGHPPGRRRGRRAARHLPAGDGRSAPRSSAGWPCGVDARRRGIATALLELADTETRSRGGRRIVLHAQTYARDAVRAGRLPRPGPRRSARPGSSTSRWRSPLTADPARGRTDARVRIDPLTGQRAIVAGARAGRPGGGLSATPPAPIDPETDPFAEGHEDRTPPELYAVRPGGGEPNTPGWTVRVVPNLYPALSPRLASSRRRTPTPTCSGPVRRPAPTR